MLTKANVYNINKLTPWSYDSAGIFNYYHYNVLFEG